MMDFVSIRQASRELRISERTLRRAVRSGELPVYRPGQRTQLVDRADLHQWIKDKRVPPWRPER